MAFLLCAIYAFITLIVGLWPASVHARAAMACSVPALSYANHSSWKKKEYFPDVDIKKFAINNIVKSNQTHPNSTAKAHALRPGIALSPAQLAQLTADIVWLVEQTVTLANGAQQKVLVPQVYLRVQPGDLDGSGALLAGRNIQLDLRGDLANSGTIAGRNIVTKRQ